MMRERAELSFQNDGMRDAGTFAVKSLTEIKCKKWRSIHTMCYPFLMCLRKPARCIVFKVSSWLQFFRVC